MGLLGGGGPVRVVAGRWGVDRRSVRRWKRAHRGQGRAGLRARPASGRPPKLAATQRRQLVRLVVAGAGAAGAAPRPSARPGDGGGAPPPLYGGVPPPPRPGPR